MRIAAQTYLAASGAQGLSLTDDLDCNCWLFDSGDGLVLFDTGAGLNVESIFEVIREDGLDPKALRYVFLTHGHGDHSGGAHSIRQQTESVLFCGELTARLLAQGEEAISLDKARQAGVYPSDYVYNTVSPDKIFKSETPIALGNLKITPIATPGHSLDHNSFLVEIPGIKALVTGDAIFHSGRIIYQGTYDFDVRESAESIRKLSSFEFDMLLPGHGSPARHGGKRHVQAAIDHINQLKTPRPIEFIGI